MCCNENHPSQHACSMRMRPWGEDLNPPEPDLCEGKPASLVLEFPQGKYNDWLHSVAFIPVPSNGYGPGYMNVNVYPRIDKGPDKGQKSFADVRTSLYVCDNEEREKYPAPLLGDFLQNLNHAAKSVLCGPRDAKLLHDIAVMEAKLAEMRRELGAS